jgi:hypothetical protein
MAPSARASSDAPAFGTPASAAHTTTSRVHCQVRSGRARSHGLTGPLCDCAIHRHSHEHARPRRRLHEAPKHARAESVKRSKKIKSGPCGEHGADNVEHEDRDIGQAR